MLQEKWFLIGLGFALAACSGAGLYYAIGVYWTGASVTYLYHSSTSIPLFTSFGTMENGTSTTATDVLPYPTGANVYYPQRLTTVPYTAP